MADADIMRLNRDQERQRATKPVKVAQSLLRDWCGSHGAVMDVFMAADLVKRVERVIVAERALSSCPSTEKK